MRAGIFVTMAGRQAAGPETYEVSLVRAIAASHSDHEYTVFCLSEAARDSFRLINSNIQFRVLNGSRWISVPFGLPRGVKDAHCDLLHATFISPPFLRVPLVFTVHDLTMLTHPEFYDPLIGFRLKHTILPAIKRARMLVCISEYVRREVQERFSIPNDRLTVVHHGVNPAYKHVENAKEIVIQRFGVEAPYVLFVGQMKLRKNILRIIEAFTRVREMGIDVKLVLVGRRGHTSEGIDEAIARHQIREHVVELGHVQDGLLPALYCAAEAFVFPSLNEGFGLPVLEAMACGTPVVTANSSALPEIAGGAALLVDATSVESIACGLSRALTDSGLRKQMVEAGLERAKQFTWRSTADLTIKAHQRARA